MPKRKTTRKKCCRRGRGLRDWARKAHSVIKSNRVLSRGANFINTRYGDRVLGKIQNPALRSIAKNAISFGINKLHQKGYGLRRAGNGLSRSGGRRR